MTLPPNPGVDASDNVRHLRKLVASLPDTPIELLSAPAAAPMVDTAAIAQTLQQLLALCPAVPETTALRAAVAGVCERLQAVAAPPAPRPELPPALQCSLAREPYEKGTLTRTVAVYLACECISAGGCALAVLQYLHENYHVGVRDILTCNAPASVAVVHDGTLNTQPLKPTWLTAAGQLDVIRYMHEHMELTRGDLQRMRHFDLFLILASGNTPLAMYLYEHLGFRQEHLEAAKDCTPLGNWAYDVSGDLSMHSQDFLDKHAPMEWLFGDPLHKHSYRAPPVVPRLNPTEKYR